MGEIAVAGASTAAAEGMLRWQCRWGEVVRAVWVPKHAAGREVGSGNAVAALGEVYWVVLGRPELGPELLGEPERLFDLRQHVVHGRSNEQHLGVVVPMVETAKQRERRSWVGCKDVHEQNPMHRDVFVCCDGELSEAERG